MLALQTPEEGERDNCRFSLGFKNSATTLLGSIRAWGSPSGIHLEIDLSNNPYLVAPIGLDEVDHEPNSNRDDSSTDD
jgi:hypothetical protein